MSKLWRFTLCPDKKELPAEQPSMTKQTLLVYSAYNLLSVGVLVYYLHIAAEFPTKSMWLEAIRARICVTWPGFTHSNTSKYFLESIEIIKSLMVQPQQGV